ncbi:MAG: hypothetical protein JST63_16615 [Bacteroidetes bacterium]|nr:hypothetical protein [Bacteroidota bacterium]
MADNYWEWKNLIGTSLVMMLPLSIYVSTNPNLVQKITSFWLKYALPLFVLIFPFLQGEAIGRYLIPVSFILLFLPCFTTKWKIFLLLIALFVITSYLGARSNIIKFGVTILIGLLYYLRKFISVKLINFLRFILLLLPLIAVMLAVANVFNIFQIGDYLSGDYSTTTTVNGQSDDENLIVDTRTFLYLDVINSAQKYNYSWFGRTPARGNESTFFEFSVANDYTYPSNERYSNEVSILNIFTWTGLVGVILYFFVFFHSSYLAIKKSKNNFMPLIGLYVAFRWCYSWVEDFNRIDLSNLYLWITIGICYSKAFREKTDQEIKNWANGIVNFSARKLYLKQNKIATGNG